MIAWFGWCFFPFFPTLPCARARPRATPPSPILCLTPARAPCPLALPRPRPRTNPLERPVVLSYSESRHLLPRKLAPQKHRERARAAPPPGGRESERSSEDRRPRASPRCATVFFSSSFLSPTPIPHTHNDFGPPNFILSFSRTHLIICSHRCCRFAGFGRLGRRPTPRCALGSEAVPSSPASHTHTHRSSFFWRRGPSHIAAH